MKRRSYKYHKPARGAAKTIDTKARSMQTAYRRYTGTTLTLVDAKKIINDPPSCPYCKRAIIWNDLSMDHIQPRSREGEDQLSNLVWCCGSCNRVKSNLTGEEFQALLTFLDQYPIMKESVLTRLRMASALFKKRRGTWQR